MFKLRPIAIALGTGLLQACATPPAPQALAMQPILQVRHSADSTAATYYQLGKYHQQRGNLDLALTAYNASIELDRRQLDPRNALASIDYQQGKFDKAKTLLLQLVAEFPTVTHPYNNLGYLQYKEGDYAAAAETFQRALTLDANNERARNNLEALRQAVASRAAANPVAAAGVTRESQLLPVAANATAGSNNVSVADVQSSTITLLQPPRVDASALAAISAPRFPVLVTESRMELIAVTPNVYDLKLKGSTSLAVGAPASRLELVALAPDVYELKLKSSAVIASSPAKDVSDKTIVAAAATPARKAVTPAARLEVANGNGVGGMAKRIGNALGQKGIAVSRLTNERPYTQQATKIEYRAGYEQAATALKRAMNGHAVLVQSSDLSAKTDMRLVLGKDAVSNMAQIENLSGVASVAVNSLANAGS